MVSFLQDNSSSLTAVITQRELEDLHFEELKHASHSPNLGISDYHVFPNLKKKLRGRIFRPLGMRCLLQTTGLQPNIQDSIWLV